ncbi:phage tail assembly protein [Brevibacillus sp. HB1.1]|uniref:phage tail assembly protein n=1 Tax=Brevibacillus sp. HB1.1 TaxID=2738808 RepID=UPI001576A74D|nr:phage tail assembly protein [Brevibacillus sp. HB1.1]NTU28849.1 phage tail assembly protein [Brevibacillus sp. HB1.1]
MLEKENRQEVVVDEKLYKLSRPFSFDGKEYTELDLDLDSITGEDLMSCERQLNASTKDLVFVKELSKPYLALVAARAAKVPVELIHKLPAKDFSKVTMLVQNFLLG